MIDTLSIVIPSYNEEENINELYNRLIKILDNLKIKSYEIIFVDVIFSFYVSVVDEEESISSDTASDLSVNGFTTLAIAS